MKKRTLSILLSLSVIIMMCIPCIAFAENEGTTNISITVCEPVPGQPYENICSIEGIDYSMSLAVDEKYEVVGSISYCAIVQNGTFDYDSTYPFSAQILCPSVNEPFTGSYTATVNGHPANVSVSEDNYSLSISYEFKTGSRESIDEIWLDGYKPVKVGTTPARITKDADHPDQRYSANGCYIRQYRGDEVSNFNVGENYQMQIYVEAPYNYTFEGITPDDIHIKGYDMPQEGITLFSEDGSFADGYLDETLSYLVITLPAETAAMNEYNFTIPAPVEGQLPGNAVPEANDDITCTGITWYKSTDSWFNSSDTVQMAAGEKFEVGYYYFAKLRYSWKGEELTPDAYTIMVNGDTYDGECYEFGRLRIKTDLRITVAEPKAGATPAQTFSANIPLTYRACNWYYLPNYPSTEGARLMEPTDTFKAGCCYWFDAGSVYDTNIYECNRIYINGVDISETYGYRQFGPIEKQTQTIKNVNAAYSKAYGTAFALKPTAKTSLTYKSSNTKVATVYKGKVTVKGVGTAKITITAAETDTYKKATKTITVKGVPKKAAISKITAGKNAMTVKMAAKVSATKGGTYQIAYRQKGTSKWKYTTTKYQSKAIKKLKKGKRYYVRVRAFKTVSNVKYYGAWSATKLSCKIK